MPCLSEKRGGGSGKEKGKPPAETKFGGNLEKKKLIVIPIIKIRLLRCRRGEGRENNSRREEKKKLSQALSERGRGGGEGGGRLSGWT